MTAFEWATGNEPMSPPSDFHCATSDVWQARFVKLAPFLVQQKFDANVAALFAGVVGEIGDNCFTHNAPTWIDVSGCWFEWDVKDAKVRCIVADRGRGILASLKPVRPALQSPSEALHTALTERVTGRAPEERGNGLKFVMEALTQFGAGAFSLQSGNAKFSCTLPLDRNAIEDYIVAVPEFLRGTYCEMEITLPYAR